VRRAVDDRAAGCPRLGAGVSLLAMLPAAARAATGEAAPLYKDPRAPVDLRVRDLLSRMTLEEKVAQLITLSRTKRDVMDDALRFDPAKANAVYPNGIGQVARPSDRGGAATANNTVTAASIAATGRWRAPGRHHRLRQRGAEVGAREHPARHPDPVPRGSAARLHGARGDQLPAGDRDGRHLRRRTSPSASAR
jgi:hypothetical protein